MPATYEPIANTTLGSTLTSVTLSSIPSTYTDLVLVFNGRIQGNVYFNFNGDTATNYSQTNINGNGGSAASNRETSVGGIYIGDYIGDPLDNSTAMTIINIQNYSNTTTFKTSLFRMSNAAKGATATVGLWRNTAAINSFTVFSSITNGIQTGSTFTLYGIKAA
jgi:hypothetical protein